MSRQLNSEIKKYLTKFAYSIPDEAEPITRIKTGRLRKSLFGKVQASTSLRFTENSYGTGLSEITNTDPFGIPRDTLRIVAEEHTDEITKGITEIITKYLKSL